MKEQILVTGASGFIGAHCVKEMLAHGYAVRGSLRDISRAVSLRAMFQEQGMDTNDLSFVEASLTEAAAWQEAASGCDGILHVASPVSAVEPKNPDELITPALEGTRHVLAAACDQGVQRVVLTSSVATVLGSVAENRLYTSDDWSDPNDPKLTTYAKSKTLAEQAAWVFCQENNIELTTIHPSLVLGPAMQADYGESLEAIVKVMQRAVPMMPRFGFGIVDVRDVASLHRLAYEQASTVNQRLIAASGFLWFREIAAILDQAYPEKRIPLREMPNWMTRIASLFVKELRNLLIELDQIKQLDITPAKNIGWQPISPKDAVLAAAASLRQYGIV